MDRLIGRGDTTTGTCSFMRNYFARVASLCSLELSADRVPVKDQLIWGTITCLCEKCLFHTGRREPPLQLSKRTG
jgi:hypothetical protein